MPCLMLILGAIALTCLFGPWGLILAIVVAWFWNYSN